MMFGIPTLWVIAAVAGTGIGLLVAPTVYRVLVAEEPHDAAEDSGAAAADRIEQVGALVYTLPATIVSQLTYVISRVLPFFGTKWWKGVAKLALYRYHKRAGGDAIGLAGNEAAGTVDLKPVKADDGVDELDDKPGWKVKGEDRVYADSYNGGMVRLGKTPIVPINEDHTRVGSWFECNVTEAIDAGQMQELYAIEGAELTADIRMDGGGTAPVADGGIVNRDFRPRDSPVFEDMIINLNSPSEFDGRALSWWKYIDHDPTTTTPEQLSQAEERGRLAGLAGTDMSSTLIKILMIAGGIIIGALAAQHLPTILRMLMGGGTGSGGGAGGFLWITADALLGAL